MLFGLICAAIAVMRLAPETWLAKALHRVLVEAPASRLARLGRGNLLLMLAVLAAAGLLVMIAKSEGMMIAGAGLPEGLAWIAAFDVGTWVDLIVVGWLLSATLRLKALRAGVRMLRLRLRARRVRTSPRARAHAPAAPRRPRPAPDNDDEPAVFARAA